MRPGGPADCSRPSLSSGVHTPRLVQELAGEGAILAAQALRENAAGVERCALIAEKNSTRNAAGYLVTLLRPAHLPAGRSTLARCVHLRPSSVCHF